MNINEKFDEIIKEVENQETKKKLIELKNNVNNMFVDTIQLSEKNVRDLLLFLVEKYFN
jgi:hypothetical protein